MSLMADPMIALLKLQQALNNGPSVDPRELDEDYLTMYDEPNGGRRYSFAKIIEGEVQALSIFGLEKPIDGIECYNVGYAVKKNHQGRGLAVEAVNKGVGDLKKRFSLTKMESFYVEAIIDVTNSYSINVAKKIFPGFGIAIEDSYTGTPSLQFKKLIQLR